MKKENSRRKWIEKSSVKKKDFPRGLSGSVVLSGALLSSNLDFRNKILPCEDLARNLNHLTDSTNEEDNRFSERRAKPPPRSLFPAAAAAKQNGNSMHKRVAINSTSYWRPRHAFLRPGQIGFALRRVQYRDPNHHRMYIE